MGAAAALFGTLGALGNFGEQRAEASQAARDEIQKRLRESEEEQAFQTQQKAAQLHLQMEQQRQPVGPSFIGQDGKAYQKYRYPLTGEEKVEESSGPLPETQEQAFYRAVTSAPINMDPATAKQLLVAMNTKNPPKSQVDWYDEAGILGVKGQWYKKNYNPYTNEVYGYEAEAPPPAWAPVTSSGYITDPTTLLQLYHSMTRQRVMPNQLGPGQSPNKPYFPAPTTLLTPPGGGQSFAAPGASGAGQPIPPPPTDEQLAAEYAAGTGQTLPTTWPSGAPTSQQQGGAAPTPQPPGVDPQTADILNQLGMPASALNNVGTYRGLVNGQIPDSAIGTTVNGIPVTVPILQAANTLMNQGDAGKISGRLRRYAENVAKAYGWRGQGSLTPAQQMQIDQVDQALKAVYNLESVKLFDSPLSSLWAGFPIDPKTEGGVGAVAQSGLRKLLPSEVKEYMDRLIRLNNVIGGIRNYSGANNSNATWTRLMGELPNFSNTSSSQEATLKLQLLMAEVSIIKRLGYFLDDGTAAAAENAVKSNPQRPTLPPPGAAQQQQQAPPVAQPKPSPGTPPPSNTMSDDEFLMKVSKPPTGP